jgi:hypothetical protein
MVWIAGAANLLDTARFLLDTTPFQQHSIELSVASYYGPVQMVQFLLDKGCDVDAPDKLFGNALQTAVHSGNAKVARLLLEKGADPNGPPGDYATPLAVAAFRGHENIVRLLLEKGADVSASDSVYDCALLAARSSRQENIARLLIQNGADINAAPASDYLDPEAPLPITWAPRRLSYREPECFPPRQTNPPPFPFRKQVASAPTTPLKFRSPLPQELY